MSEIPEDMQELIERLMGGTLNNDLAMAAAAALIAARDNLLAERQAERARWQPAVTYFERYCQDEAASVEDCVCGEAQHEDAKAFAAAIRRQP